MDNKKRIQELKRKNQIANLCKDWEVYGVQVTIDNFLDVQETLLLQDKVLDKLDEMDDSNMSIIYQGYEKNMISDFENILIRYIENEQSYVFFVKEATKVGGLVLEGKTIIEQSQFFIKESELFCKGCSIIFCTLKADKGVCLWKGEYDTRFYMW